MQFAVAERYDGQLDIEGIWRALRDRESTCDARYSLFRVTACLETSDYRYFGSNFENVSYPAGLCAESAAVGVMIASGGPQLIRRVFIYSPSNKGGLSPCGFCLQRLSPYVTATTEVFAFSPDSITLQENFQSLLGAPFSF